MFDYSMTSHISRKEFRLALPLLDIPFEVINQPNGLKEVIFFESAEDVSGTAISEVKGHPSQRLDLDQDLTDKGLVL